MDQTIREHDAVVLLRDLPQHNLVAGESGVVVYSYTNAPAFEVEFPTVHGKPRYIVATVEAVDLLKLHHHSHGRRAAS